MGLTAGAVAAGSVAAVASEAADHEPLSAAGWVQQTPPGYAIIDLYEDGAVENRYMPHTY